MQLLFNFSKPQKKRRLVTKRLISIAQINKQIDKWAVQVGKLEERVDRGVLRKGRRVDGRLTAVIRLNRHISLIKQASGK